MQELHARLSVDLQKEVQEEQAQSMEVLVAEVRPRGPCLLH
jgi:hypothetical protein